MTNVEIDNKLLECFFPGMKFGKLIKSPLRKDKHPSFAFYKTKTGRIEYKDFGNGNQGSLVDLLRFLTNKNYKELLESIQTNQTNRNFVSEANPSYSNTSNTSNKSYTQKTNISVKKNTFNNSNVKYWSKYGIKLETLIKCNVYPISSFIIGNTLYKADDIAFAYERLYNGDYLYKIYQPFNKTMKWRNNVTKNIIYDQLIDYVNGGECCILTSSVKDMMCLYDNYGTPSFCGNSETWIPEPNVINTISKLYKHIYLLYDNDDTGIKMSKKISELYGLKSMVCVDAKDPSDSFLKTNKINLKWLK